MASPTIDGCGSRLTLAVIHGTHLCLLDESRLGKNTEVPAIHLQSLCQIFDVHLTISKIRPKEWVSNAFECIAGASNITIGALILAKSSLEEDHQNEISFIQYPIEKGGKSVYVGDNNEVQIRRNDIPSETSFVISVHDVCSFQQSPLMEIASSGYIIEDFCGKNGYEQVLFLPEFDCMPLNAETKTFQEMKSLFRKILHKCVLVDGIKIMCHEENKLELKLPVTRLASFNISPMESTIPAESQSINKQKAIKKKAVDDRKALPLPTERLKRKITSLPVQDREWQKKLRFGLQERLDREQTLQKKDRDISKIKAQLVLQSRRTLQELTLSRNGAVHNSKLQKLEMISMRYNLHSVNWEGNEVLLKIHLEVDVHMKSFKNTSMDSNGLFDVQLSCSPISSHHELSVRTQSALVPKFEAGDCFTLLALITISGRISTKLRGCTSVRLILNAFFHVNQIQLNACETKMNAAKLCIITLPEEIMTMRHDNFTHDVHMKDYDSSLSCASAGIFDWRAPRTLLIDISNFVSKNVQNDWQRIIDSINESCIVGNLVDWYRSEDEMNVELAISSTSREERLQLLKQVLRFIPDEAKLIGTTTKCVDEKYMVKSLSDAMNRELQVIEEFVSSSETASLGNFIDVVTTQYDGDVIVAHVLNDTDSC